MRENKSKCHNKLKFMSNTGNTIHVIHVGLLNKNNS